MNQIQKKWMTIAVFTALIFSGIQSSCSKSAPDTTNTDEDFDVTEAESTDAWAKVYEATSLQKDGDYWVVTSEDLPDHQSVYYEGTEWEDTLFAEYNESGFRSNNISIQKQTLSFRIPIIPKKATTHDATPGGPMGIALNGVPFFNQYNGSGDPLTIEIESFDQYKGHAAPVLHDYHYHAEPTYLTATKGSNALLGFLLDGFPVYGPVENGITITNDDLDEYHGHVGITEDYPRGIYHYHITDADPYINGNGFYGTPGTVSH